MSNLLDRSSLVLTPTAYNNGEALCIKPDDASGDFQFSRNSAATRVNAQGLVENVQILSSNLVQNGDFSEEGSEEVSNGSFSQEGVQLISNGSFDTDTKWTTNTGWSISGGSANCDGTQSGNTTLVQQNGIKGAIIDFVVGKTYKVNFDIVVTSGQISNIEVASGYDSNAITTSGNHTAYITAVSTNDRFTITANPSFIGSIDNVSVREVGQDWDIIGTGWSFGEDKIVSVNGSNYGVHQSAIVSGKTYKITYEVKDYVSGSFSIRANTVNGSVTASANGTYTDYITSNGNFLRLMGGGNFNGSVTNISVKEVGQNWTLGTGWEIGNDVANAVNAPFGSQLVDSATLTASKKYSVSFVISNYIQGSVKVAVGNVLSSDVSADGNYTFILTSANTNAFKVQARGGGSGTTLSITNISVIEITDDTNLPRINYEGFSYDGSGNVVPDSGCGSWLWEPQSTNLLPYSEDFTQWGKANYTVQSNVAVSPSGNFDASFVTNPSGGGGLIKQVVNVTASTVYTFSFYAKRGTASDAKYSVYDNTNGGDIIPSTSYYSQINSDTFTRITVSFTAPVGCTSLAVYVLRDNLAVGNTIVWGAMLEQNSFSTSYIPTSGSTVTRNQDLCTNGGSLASINSPEGVLYAEIAALANDGTVRAIYISNGTTSNRLWIEFDAVANRFEARYIANGTTSANFFHTVSEITDFNKIAFKWKENDFSLYVNGVEVANDTNGSVINADTLNRVDFHNQASSSVQNLFGKTKAVAVWKEALSDQELAELTTI